MHNNEILRRNVFVCLATAAVLLLIGFPADAFRSPAPAPEATELISTLPPPGSGTDIRTCFCRAVDTNEVLCNQDPSFAWTFGPDPICPENPAACPDHEVSGLHGDACTGYRYVPDGQCGTWVPVDGKIFCLGGTTDIN